MLLGAQKQLQTAQLLLSSTGWKRMVPSNFVYHRDTGQYMPATTVNYKHRRYHEALQNVTPAKNSSRLFRLV